MTTGPSASLPQVIVTPSTPLPPSPDLGWRSSSTSPPLDQVRPRAIFNEEFADCHLLSPGPALIHRSPPKKRSAAISILFLLLAVVLVASSALCTSNTVLSHPSFDQLGRLGRAIDLRLRLAIDLRRHHTLSSKLQSFFRRNHPIQAIQAIDAASAITSASTSESHTAVDHPSQAATVTSAGPALSHHAWNEYLKQRERITGQAGPTALMEVWDFH